MMTAGIGYTPADSCLHRLNPLLKFVGLIALTIGIMVYPDVLLSLLLLALILIGFGVAGIYPKLAMRRVKFLFLFSLLVFMLQVLITTNGLVLFYLVPSVGNSPPIIPVTTFGIQRGLALALRFLIIVFSSMLFVETTDPTLLAHSLTRVGIPYRYTFALVIALRFLPLFDVENHVVQMAQKARGLSTNLRSFTSILRSVRFTFFPLLVSALSRVDELSMSMDGRGFGYMSQRVYLRQSQWTRSDTLLAVSLVVFMVLCVLASLNVTSLM
jgi:energy-coupling factor transport system permease protein